MIMLQRIDDMFCNIEDMFCNMDNILHTAIITFIMCHRYYVAMFSCFDDVGSFKIVDDDNEEKLKQNTNPIKRENNNYDDPDTSFVLIIYSIIERMETQKDVIVKDIIILFQASEGIII